MNAVFADASYFIALLIPNDLHHKQAFGWSAQATCPIITSEYVLVEVGNFISPLATRHLFDPFLRSIRSDRRLMVIPGSVQWFAQGAELYHRRRDKAWSLVDCISFAIMGEKKLAEALTTDHHFEQAGFQRLLKT